MFKITAYFNQIIERRRQRQAESKARDEAGKLAMAAIARNTSTDLEKILDDNGMDILRLNWAFFKAIDVDALECFEVLLKKSGISPGKNLVSGFDSGIGGTRYIREISMLAYALQNDAHKISLYLAKHPETNIKSSGYSQSSIYRSGGFTGSGYMEKKKDVYDPPLKLARKAGMNDVVAVLAERLAVLKREEAAKLECEARQLKV